MVSVEFIAVILGLLCGSLWGIGDFSGGIASRKTSPLAVVLFAQIIGMGILAVPAVIRAEAWPAWRDVGYGALASAIGIIALAALYRAMAIGQIGIASPITSILATCIPVAYGAVTNGLPSSIQLFGFALAIVGVVLLSRQAASKGTVTGVGLALVAGIGIAGFFILIAQTSRGTMFWPLVMARATAILIVLIYSLTRQQFVLPPISSLPYIAVCGGMNALGNVFFLLAGHLGRLDITAVLGSLSPVTTVILALIFLRERFTRLQSVGAVLAFAAILVIAGSNQLKPLLASTADTQMMQSEGATPTLNVPKPMPTTIPVVITLTETVAPRPRVFASVSTGDFVNIRRGASTRTRVISRMYIGQQAEVIGYSEDGKWWQIRTDRHQGWVSAEFVNIEGDTTAIPIQR